MPNFLKLLFSPTGRIGRRDYIYGLVGMVVITTAVNFILGHIGGSILAFLISLPFPFIVLHMTYFVYGKRLHDFGRSFWPVTGLISSLLLVMIVIMLTFGGSEYFEAFSQFSPDNPPSEEVSRALQDQYQARLSQGTGWLYGSMIGLIACFSIWLFLAKPDPKENRYGPPAK